VPAVTRSNPLGTEATENGDELALGSASTVGSDEQASGSRTTAAVVATARLRTRPVASTTSSVRSLDASVGMGDPMHGGT